MNLDNNVVPNVFPTMRLRTVRTNQITDLVKIFLFEGAMDKLFYPMDEPRNKKSKVGGTLITIKLKFIVILSKILGGFH